MAAGHPHSSWGMGVQARAGNRGGAPTAVPADLSLPSRPRPGHGGEGRETRRPPGRCAGRRVPASLSGDVALHLGPALC